MITLTGTVRINSTTYRINYNTNKQEKVFDVSIYYDDDQVINAKIVLEGHDKYYNDLCEAIKKYFKGDLKIIV